MKHVGDRYLIKLQGYSAVKNRMWFDPGISECGNIKNGVAISLGDEIGMFVFAYSDLIAMVDEAKRQRENRSKP